MSRNFILCLPQVIAAPLRDRLPFISGAVFFGALSILFRPGGGESAGLPDRGTGKAGFA
jgi:hypothetical protein